MIIFFKKIWTEIDTTFIEVKVTCTWLNIFYGKDDINVTMLTNFQVNRAMRFGDTGTQTKTSHVLHEK